MTKPITGWPGGKSRHVKFLNAHLPTAERFVDLFGGSGAVLLSRPPSKLDVYNDLNRDLVRLFRVVRDEPGKLERALALTPHNRSEYDAAAHRPAWLDDVEWARRFLIRAGQAYSGQMDTGWSKSKSPQRSALPRATQKWLALAGRVGPVAERLLRVQIDCRPALEAIRLYDHAGTLFYADPPYLHSVRNDAGRSVYGELEMSAMDHAALIEALSEAKGNAALSGYRSAAYDELLSSWQRYDAEPAPLSASNTGAASRGTRVESLWIKRSK